MFSFSTKRIPKYFGRQKKKEREREREEGNVDTMLFAILSRSGK